MDPRFKQLRIKSGVLKRCVKEKQVYEQELVRELNRLETMKNTESKDEHDLKYQEKVILESQMMVPDCQKRIYNAYNDLKSIMQDVEEELGQTEEFLAAKVILDASA